MTQKGILADPESIKKMVATRKANGNYGWTDKRREALSQKMRGVKFTDEHKQKIREALANRGFSEGHKKQLSISKKGKISNSEQHQNLIAKYIEDYKKDGFLCIRIDNRPLPDFIAIKDGRPFAIEVEGGSIKPIKYLCPNDYADIVWIHFRRVKNG